MVVTNVRKHKIPIWVYILSGILILGGIIVPIIILTSKKSSPGTKYYKCSSSNQCIQDTTGGKNYAGDKYCGGDSGDPQGDCKAQPSKTKYYKCSDKNTCVLDNSGGKNYGGDKYCGGSSGHPEGDCKAQPSKTKYYKCSDKNTCVLDNSGGKNYGGDKYCGGSSGHPEGDCKAQPSKTKYYKCSDKNTCVLDNSGGKNYGGDKYCGGSSGHPEGDCKAQPPPQWIQPLGGDCSAEEGKNCAPGLQCVRFGTAGEAHGKCMLPRGSVSPGEKPPPPPPLPGLGDKCTPTPGPAGTGYFKDKLWVAGGGPGCKDPFECATTRARDSSGAYKNPTSTCRRKSTIPENCHSYNCSALNPKSGPSPKTGAGTYQVYDEKDLTGKQWQTIENNYDKNTWDQISCVAGCGEYGKCYQRPGKNSLGSNKIDCPAPSSASARAGVY